MANATASSLLSVALFGAATSANYAVSGLVDWGLAGMLLLGGVVGGVVGIPVARRLGRNASLARRLFGAGIVAVALYVGWRAIAD